MLLILYMRPAREIQLLIPLNRSVCWPRWWNNAERFRRNPIDIGSNPHNKPAWAFLPVQLLYHKKAEAEETRHSSPHDSLSQISARKPEIVEALDCFKSKRVAFRFISNLSAKGHTKLLSGYLLYLILVCNRFWSKSGRVYPFLSFSCVTATRPLPPPVDYRTYRGTGSRVFTSSQGQHSLRARTKAVPPPHAFSAHYNRSRAFGEWHSSRAATVGTVPVLDANQGWLVSPSQSSRPYILRDRERAVGSAVCDPTPRQNHMQLSRHAPVLLPQPFGGSPDWFAGMTCPVCPSDLCSFF